jgi:hypothetical protein
MRLIIWLVGVGLSLVACASVTRSGAGQPASRGLIPSSSQIPSKPAPGPLKVGPIAYFQQNCAHCHGPFGDSYTDHFYTITDFEKLKVDVKRMADGPGQSPLDSNELTAQVDFHKALIAKGPFLCWSEQDGQILKGEVTKGSTVEAHAGSKSIPVEVKRWHWSLELPVDVKASEVILKAVLDKKETTLELAAQAWSTKVAEAKESTSRTAL